MQTYHSSVASYDTWLGNSDLILQRSRDNSGKTLLMKKEKRNNGKHMKDLNAIATEYIINIIRLYVHR